MHVKWSTLVWQVECFHFCCTVSIGALITGKCQNVFYLSPEADWRFFLARAVPLRNSITDWWGKQILKLIVKRASSQGEGVVHPCTLPLDTALGLFQTWLSLLPLGTTNYLSSEMFLCNTKFCHYIVRNFSDICRPVVQRVTLWLKGLRKTAEWVHVQIQIIISTFFIVKI